MGKKKVVRKKTVSKKKIKSVKKAVKPAKNSSPPKKEVPKDLPRPENMKRISKILQDAYIRQNLIGVGGENALSIIKNFYGRHSDEELAKKLKIKISDVRATLNKLHNEGLVNYNRQKDSETGWYSYSWTLNHERMERWANDQTNKIEDVHGDGEKYYCPSCGAATITDFETASSGNFKCCQCERMLEFLDRNKMLELYDRKRLG
ncbi:hypothetical protein JXA56_01995 [Candidatus Micrarchaeota archaeon]|nr:hypothetical protein [Candidatus Micrarchaeota archaeon]